VRTGADSGTSDSYAGGELEAENDWWRVLEAVWDVVARRERKKRASKKKKKKKKER